MARNYVRDSWQMVSAFAREKHQSEGRGIVVLNTEKVYEKDGAHIQPVRYTTRVEGPSIRALSASLGLDIAEAVATYDPKSEAVVMVTRAYNALDEGYDELRTGAPGHMEDYLDRAEDLMREAKVARETSRLGIAPRDADEKRPAIVTVDVYAFDKTG